MMRDVGIRRRGPVQLQGATVEIICAVVGIGGFTVGATPRGCPVSTRHGHQVSTRPIPMSIIRATRYEAICDE